MRTESDSSSGPPEEQMEVEKCIHGSALLHRGSSMEANIQDEEQTEKPHIEAVANYLELQ